MSKLRHLWACGFVFVCFFFIGVLSLWGASKVRLTGYDKFQVYGYQDAGGADHLWLMGNTSFSISRSNSPYSFHFSAGYLGDNEDEFSESGSGRFYRGFLQYGRFGDMMQIKAGRFFQYRGVFLGTLDGVDFQKQINDKTQLALFGGMSGPRNREFEMGSFSEDQSFGGELKLRQGSSRFFRASVLSISYAHQTRMEEAFRDRAGISIYGKVNNRVTSSAVIRLRLNGSVMERLSVRIRYLDRNWRGMLEGGMYSYEFDDASWFADFEQNSYNKFRFTIDRYLSTHSWAIGVEGSMMLTEESGTRLGPSVQTPWGRAGYRISMGEQPLSSGPWANVTYALVDDMELYINGAMYSYEWDQQNIESDDIINLNAGCRYSPHFLTNRTFTLEFQSYRTPQLSSDRRMLFNVIWRYDTGRTG